MKTRLLAVFCLTWASVAYADDLKPLDSKVMLRGYCFVGSRHDTQSFGGFATYDNFPKKLDNKKVGNEGKLSLIAVPSETIPFSKSYRGFRLLLVNRTQSELPFSASDSRLSIIQEAVDTKGKWRPIEYLPSSWCGNSYHRVFLPAGHYWEFAAPEYTGSYKTKLRFVLNSTKPLYSNEFDGTISPLQFSAKERHNPSNLMDPYNE